MPNYPFRCSNGHLNEVFFLFEEISSNSSISCKICDQEAKRVYEMPLMKFNAGGFHNNQYPDDTREMKRKRALASEKKKKNGRV